MDIAEAGLLTTISGMSIAESLLILARLGAGAGTGATSAAGAALAA